MKLDLSKKLFAVSLVAMLSTGAWAQTDNGTTGQGGSETGTAGESSGSDTAGGATAGTEGTDKGGVDATTGNQGPWAPEIGNALFVEGYTGLRDPEDAKSRWTALSAENQNTVKADCDRFEAAGMTGQTALIQTAMDPISTEGMTALCTLVGTF